MSNEKHYPLHPGQDHVPPYYVQVPQSEYESLKRENEQLHALLHDATKQSATAEIDTLASECRALRSMNAKAQEEIAMLKENQRWRKCSDGFPAIGISVLISDGFVRMVAALMHDYTWNVDEAFYDVDDYKFWMPLPKAPEGA